MVNFVESVSTAPVFHKLRAPPSLNHLRSTYKDTRLIAEITW